MENVNFCFLPNDVFEGRNKEYGAYWLRGLYKKRLILATLAGSVVFALIVYGPSAYHRLDGRANDRKMITHVVNLSNLEAPPLNPKVSRVHEAAINGLSAGSGGSTTKTGGVSDAAGETTTGQGKGFGNERGDGAGQGTVGNGSGLSATGMDRAYLKLKTRNMIHESSDDSPEIVGGLGAYYIHIVYPEEAAALGIEGRLMLEFVVEADGYPSHIRVKKPLHPLCDSAAVQALRLTRFMPGKIEGQNVRVRMRLPVRFQIVNNPAGIPPQPTTSSLTRTTAGTGTF